MAKKKNCPVFMDVSIDGDPVERMVFELFYDVAPKTAENFRALCTGEKGVGPNTGKSLHYKGSFFHQIVKGSIARGGDFVNRNGTGGESIYGSKFPDESPRLKHDAPGLLSMPVADRDTLGSHFIITFKADPRLDRKHVIFGKLVQGHNILKKIEDVGDEEGLPSVTVKIINCGEHNEDTVVHSIDNMEVDHIVRTMVEFGSKALVLGRRVGSLYRREVKEVGELQGKVDKLEEEKTALVKEKEGSPVRTDNHRSVSRSPVRSRDHRSASVSPVRSLSRGHQRSSSREPSRRSISRSPVKVSRKSISRSPVRSSARNSGRVPLRSISRSPVRVPSRGNHRSYSRSPRGRSLSRSLSPDVSPKRIRRGRGFSERYSYARRYRTPSQSPVRSYRYNGRSDRDRYSDYRRYSPRRNRSPPPRRRTPPRFRSRRSRTPSVSRSPRYRGRRYSRSRSPVRSRSPAGAYRRRVERSRSLSRSSRSLSRSRSPSLSRASVESQSPRKNSRSRSRSQSSDGKKGLVSYGDGSPDSS
ncbi:peptidyl-prolyl isomerase G [Vigna unguiculata]|uniref:peptidylprolyl isomerase n=1 Tax=Vigna unguiculata TaxID=3917 RepID=A0A4D6MF78_VIGUN|nr:peptidyl-prolyl isomerase G [Vigna unguiculata]